MKAKLIGYHRRQQNKALSKLSGDNMRDIRVADFHSRAAAWLESLDDGLAVSAAAESQIQRENQSIL